MNDEVRRERYRASFKALFEVAKALTEDLSIEDILRRIAREACGLVNAGECSIMLLDDTRTRLLTAAAHGLTPDEEKNIAFSLGQGVAGWVASEGKTACIADVRQDPRFLVSPDQEIAIRSILTAPLLSKRGVIGVISVTHPDRTFDEDDRDLLELLGDAIVLDLEIVRLRHLAYRDALTGAWSRQGMASGLEVAIRGARRDQKPLSVILIDLDHFKRINDEHGHPAGDTVLREIVRRVKDGVRSRDAVYRYGGDEFLVLAPGAGLRRARLISERLRRAVARELILIEGGALHAAVTCGVAALRASDSYDGASLVARADAELLAGKRSR